MIHSLFFSSCLQSNPERYVKDAFQWMVPFLHRCEAYREGAAKSLLASFLVGLAQQDLTVPLIIFQQSKPVVSFLKPIIHTGWAVSYQFGIINAKLYHIVLQNIQIMNIIIL